VFDAATWAAELNWIAPVDGHERREPVQRRRLRACNGKDKWDGCATQNYLGVGASFTPTWFQVFPGVDLSAPADLRDRRQRQRATTFGGNQGLGNYSLGLGADVLQKYRFDLKYIDFSVTTATTAPP
jgi:hypothetical protein